MSFVHMSHFFTLLVGKTQLNLLGRFHVFVHSQDIPQIWRAENWAFSQVLKKAKAQLRKAGPTVLYPPKDRRSTPPVQAGAYA